MRGPLNGDSWTRNAVAQLHMNVRWSGILNPWLQLPDCPAWTVHQIWGSEGNFPLCACQEKPLVLRIT